MSKEKWLCRGELRAARRILNSRGGLMPKGVIKWFNDKKGFGFISSESGGDVFVHYTGIKGDGFRTLSEGDKVEFEMMVKVKSP